MWPPQRHLIKSNIHSLLRTFSKCEKSPWTWSQISVQNMDQHLAHYEPLWAFIPTKICGKMKMIKVTQQCSWCSSQCVNKGKMKKKFNITEIKLTTFMDDTVVYLKNWRKLKYYQEGPKSQLSKPMCLGAVKNYQVVYNCVTLT